MAGFDPLQYPSLPPNYVTIVHLKERWLKEKERKQQEEKEKQENEEKRKYPVLQNNQNRIANVGTHSRALVGKNLYKRENRIGKGWREVGLIAKEPNSKEVKITVPVVEEGTRGKKEMDYSGNRKNRVERDMGKVSTIDVAEEEMMAVVSVENGGKESSKGKCKWNSENQKVKEVATVCMVDENKVDKAIARQNCGVGFWGNKNSWRKMGDRVGEVSDKADSVEQSEQNHNAGKEKVSVDVKERTTEKVRVSGAFLAYGDSEVASVCTVEVVGGNKVDREIAGQNCGVGYRGNKNGGRGEVSDKAGSAEQSGQERNVGKEKASVDVKERTNEKVRVSGAFCANDDKEVASVCPVEVVGGNKVDKEIAGQNCGVGNRGKKNSWRKMGVRVGEVSIKADSGEQSGQEVNIEKEKVSVDVKERTTEKVRVGGAFRANGDKEVASVCTMEIVGENKVYREITGKNCGVGYRGKTNSWRKMGDRVGEASDKAESGEQSGQELNAEKEKVSVDVKERTNEKVRMSGAFRAYGDNEVVSVCTVEVVGENKVDREITGQNCGVGFRGKKHSWRKMANKGGEVSDKAESAEQSGQERNAEKEKVSVDVKERTNEKVRVGGELHSYSDKEVEEVATVFTAEVVEENKVDREITGQKCTVGKRGRKHSRRKMGVRVGEVSNKADGAEQSGQERNAEKEKVSVDVKERTNEKVTVSGAFHAFNDKKAEEVAPVCTVEVVEENKVDREITGKKHRVVLRGKKHNWRKMDGRVGFSGKKHSWRKIGDRVGEVSNKANSAELSGQEHNAEKEKVSVDVEERSNEKVRVKGALCAYGDKEVEEVATVCTVEVVEENKVDREITGQKCRVGYRGKKHSGGKMANRVGEVSDKADSVEQSGQERNAEKEEASVFVKEKTKEKARVRGAFRAYSDKSKDVLIHSEDGLKMTIESDPGDLSMADRRYGHGRSSVGVYGEKWRCESFRRYEPRKMLKQRDNSFAWIKKGESSNGHVAEIETQGLWEKTNS